jgi:hypothetical protein
MIAWAGNINPTSEKVKEGATKFQFQSMYTQRTEIGSSMIASFVFRHFCSMA